MQALDNSGRAKTVVNVFYISIAVSVLSVFADTLEFENLDSYYTEDFGMTDLFVSIVGLAHTATRITLIVVFINWFRRAYANLHRIGVGTLKHNDLHAAWCWFVPILSLFRPYQIMKEIWTETQVQINRLNGTYSLDANTTNMGAWWGFYLFSSVIGNIGMRLTFRADSIEDLEAATVLVGLSDFLDIPAAIFAVLIVKKISNFESLLQHEFEATSFGQPEQDINTEEQADSQ